MNEVFLYLNLSPKMFCTSCKAKWSPSKDRIITKCPFCAQPLFGLTGDNNAPHEILLKIVEQFGRVVLKESRLKGLITDLMPHAEKKYLRIFKQAVDDGIGATLLDMDDGIDSGKDLQIRALKDNFRNINGFTETADYIVDCFLYAINRGDNSKDNNRQSLWRTKKFIATNEDRDYGCIPGKEYILWVAQRDGTTKSGKKIEKGDWFLVEGESDSQLEPSNKKNDFESVKIGNQVWMKKNLDVSHFRNGDPIPEAKTKEEWQKAGEEGKPAWCYYNNKPELGEIYGKLYNWFAINDTRGFAPEGWHVPSDSEWNELTEFLGGWENAGIKLKSTSFWKYDGNGTNASMFNGLPGGCRNSSGEFMNISTDGYWWCSNEYNSIIYWFQLRNYTIGIEYKISKTFLAFGFSVRCLKDKTTI